jgi:hypothetical protein
MSDTLFADLVLRYTYKGDVPGHEFHGNQYTEGGGSGGDGGSESSDGDGGGASANADIPSTHQVKRNYRWREDAQDAIRDQFRSIAMGRAKNPDRIKIKKELIGGPYPNGSMLYRHTSGGTSVYHVDMGGDGHEVYSER